MNLNQKKRRKAKAFFYLECLVFDYGSALEKYLLPSSNAK